MRSIKISDTVYELYVKYLDQCRVDLADVDDSTAVFILLATMDTVTKLPKQHWVPFKQNFVEILVNLDRKIRDIDAALGTETHKLVKTVKNNIPEGSTVK